MGDRRRLTVRHGATRNPDPVAAVAELRSALDQAEMSGVLFFCSPKYDLARLGPALQAAFSVPVVGCTSAGQISLAGFQQDGIAAVSIASPEMLVKPYLITPLSRSQEEAARVVERLTADLASTSAGRRTFGLLLVDGVSMAEERLTSALYQCLGDVPIVGGSAGDDLAFDKTFVYFEGRFLNDAATFTAFQTEVPFTSFKVQNFTPTTRRMVVTAAEPDSRTVTEIDGLPAAEGYAAALGLTPAALDAAVFINNPVMLRVGNDYYVRSIQKMREDLALVFLCAIEEGLVLTVGRPADALATAETAFAEVRARIGAPELVIGCDCVLRRLELEKAGQVEAMGALFAAQRLLGFSTYGEQFNGLHVNQTLTGVALGG